VLKGRRTVLLWCRDIKNTWQSELEEGKPPELVEGAVLDLGPLHLNNMSLRFYDPWENRWTPGTFSGDALRLPGFKRSLIVRLTQLQL
jgi:hypothetical protein